ncbi:nitrogenase component 1 [Clostridium septicum]
MINSVEIINKLSKLSDIDNIKDVKSLTSASFPGPHCPLFGSALLLKEIKDAVFVVIGTDECSYYTKQMTMRSEMYGGIDGRCVSIILSQHDVTFGCQKR